MREKQHRLYKLNGSYQDEYLWIVLNEKNEWTIVAKGPRYSLFSQIGERGAAVENGRLLVDSLSKHTFEAYIIHYEESLAIASPFENFYRDFHMNCSFTIEDCGWKGKSLKELLDSKGERPISDGSYLLCDPPEEYVAFLHQNQISIWPEHILNTDDGKPPEWVYTNSKSMKQLSIF